MSSPSASRAAPARLRVFVFAALACTAGACAGDRPASAPAAPTTAPTAAPPATDSLVERALATMQAQAGPAPAELADGAPSEEALVRRHLAALARRDTAGLRRLLLTPPEFAHFYFPSSYLRRPPTALEPDAVWTQIRAQSVKGAAAALRLYGGRPLRYVAHQCAAEARQEGENRIRRGCVVRFVRAPGDTTEARFIASLIERGRRFKVISYDDDL